MAITTLDGWIAATKQRTAFSPFIFGRTTVAFTPFTTFDLSGEATLAGTNTAAGIVPTDATAGYPKILAFGGGNKGYLSGVSWFYSALCGAVLYDRVFQAGAYSFNAATTLASQPSYSGRMPGGTDFSMTEIWFECVTAFTGNPTLTVTYTGADGSTGRTTGAVAFGFAPTAGRMYRMPLQAGDSGVQKIESVTMTVATVGTFNINVLRRLWRGRTQYASDGGVHTFLDTGMPEIFDTSALFQVIEADSTAIPTVHDLMLTIVDG